MSIISKFFYKRIFSFCTLVVCSCMLFASDLIIDVKDIRLERDDVAGYHLYVRKKPAIESVILVETTKDPEGKEPNYAYRAAAYNTINGDEKRLLNGEFLESEYSRYSLIDSTPEADENFGQAFHIYIPETLLYGYPWSRNGEEVIKKGTFINIRSFEKPYADYEGEFLDNPFMFNFEAPPKPAAKEEVLLIDSYNPTASYAFAEIASGGSGEHIYSKGPESIVEDVMNSFNNINPKDVIDVVFAIDATGSMKDDIEILRTKWVPELVSALENCGKVRLGLLLYRDYGDSFKYKDLPLKYFPFTEDINLFFKNLNSFKIYGTEGGDIPEAVYEALYGAIEFYDWNVAAQKKVILIGDAEPHPKPRGYKIKCTKELIESMAKDKNITIDTIITPDEKDKRR